MKYKLKIKGLDSPDGTISILALKELVDLVLDCSERGLRLAVQGESVKRGGNPCLAGSLIGFHGYRLGKGINNARV